MVREKVRDFSETEAGEVELLKWKARSGRLASRHRFEVGDGAGKLRFTRLDAALSPEGKMDAAIITFLKGLAPNDASLRDLESGVEGTAAKVRERVKELAAIEAQPVKAIERGDNVRFSFDPAVLYEAPAAVLDF